MESPFCDTPKDQLKNSINRYGATDQIESFSCSTFQNVSHVPFEKNMRKQKKRKGFISEKIRIKCDKDKRHRMGRMGLEAQSS